MRRLKPAPGPWIELDRPDARPFRPSRTTGSASATNSRWLAGRDVAPKVRAEAVPWRDPISVVFGVVWAIATFPFRLVFGVFGLVGRIIAASAGFAVMVAGAALLAGPLGWVGIPVFLLGLIIALRAL